MRDVVTTTAVCDGARSAIVVNPAPRVSLVIPTYNRAASLGRLLRCLAGITQANAGRARARDKGWRSSRGEIVVFLDDDVVPEVDAVAHMVRALDGADGVGARILPLNTSPLISHYMHVDGIVNHYTVGERVLWLITAAAAFR